MILCVMLLFIGELFVCILCSVMINVLCDVVLIR